VVNKTDQNQSGQGKSSYPPFSAMICLYKNNDAKEVYDALHSAFVDQDCPPTELVAVLDGPVPDAVMESVDQFLDKTEVKKVQLEKNMGHGVARATAIENSSYPWMAIIDADDISAKDRFSSLVDVIIKHPETAVVGGGYTEFTDDGTGRVIGKQRMLPASPEGVRQCMQKRSPVAQATAMLRVDAIKDVGNYQHWYNNEDFYLWIRLVSRGYDIRNVEKSLLLVRTTPDFYDRRGGLKYWKNEMALQKFSLSSGTTTGVQFILGGILRFMVQVAMPGKVRTAFYNKFLRQ
jgi:glycosyltransferase involved in cell wall biosynthesis